MKRKSCYRLSLAIATALVAPSAFSQQDDDSPALENVTVTGTRIVRDGFNTPTPVTVLSAEDIALSGSTTLGDFLNELPQLGSTFSLGNSSRFIGTAGLNLLDLRRLGTNRTLVLVDGRRHVAGTPGSAAVDVNTIPMEMVERVEVITGGASAIYGADAVTGVVNFILRDDYEGVSFSGQYGQADDSSFTRDSISLTAGRNFGSGGNAVFSVEMATQDALSAKDRPQTGIPVRLVNNPADGDSGGTNDGIPDQIYVQNAGLWIISTGGLVPLGSGYIFDPDGSFRQVNRGTDFGGGECTNCDFIDLRNTTQLQPELERLALNGKLSYAFDDAHSMFLEAKYVDVQTLSSGQPAFDFGRAITVNRDNAYLDSNATAFMDANGLATLPVRRFNEDAGLRIEDNERETARIVLGLEGQLNNSWDYNVSGVWGRTTQTQVNNNNRINDRWLASTDAVVDPSTGNVVCRATIDPNATLPGSSTPVPTFARTGCIPTSIFGDGAVNPAAAAWFNTDAIRSNEIEQKVVSGYATTEFGGLAAGPIGFAGGVEYREEESSSNPDPLSALGLTFLNALAPTVGDYDVTEVFAEFTVPLLANAPFAESLSLDVAGRFADYSTVGNAPTWKAGLDWQPMEDIRFRTTYSEAIRAPNIGELFGGRSQNFFTVTDPCSEDQLNNGINGRATREANCRALGIAQGFDSTVDAATIPGFSGGNPGLSEEEAETFTAGFVFTPSWAEGLALSIDYWDIQIDESIATVTGQQIVNRCVDDPGGINNQFCALVTRDGMSELTSILSISQNVQALEASGYDLEASYGMDLYGGRLTARTIATYLEDNVTFPFQSDPTSEVRNDSFLGQPELAGNINLTYDRGNWQVNWESRYLDSMSQTRFETLANNPDIQAQNFTGGVTYHDLQVRYRFDNGLELYAGGDNIGDKDAPVFLTATGNGSGLYDNIGRFYYGGLRFAFE